MRLLVLLFFAGVPGCYLFDADGDGLPDAYDCAPGSHLVRCAEPSVLETGVEESLGETGDSPSPPDDTDTGCPATAWYPDADLDGFGDAAGRVDWCDQPAGYVADGSDCDDGDASVHPGASERCDGLDQDCDGEADENLADVWYADLDGDGYGAGMPIEVICQGSSGGLVDNDADCNDSAAEVHPGGTETCNGADDDCDGTADEEAAGAPVWFEDLDSDGYGNSLVTQASCAQPLGWVDAGDDCSDQNFAVYPGAPELCNAEDDDCDGAVPSSETDEDLDGLSDCAGDCDDASASAFPGAGETCNGADDDCDGVTDESDASDASTWYPDSDGDGYGDAAYPWISCLPPSGYVADLTDCDDAAADVSPGASETCDGVDNDCDGAVDESDADDARAWAPDADGDGYGSDDGMSFVASCEQPSGYVADFSDCDDADALVNPMAPEEYDDLIDNDCNGIVDDSGVYCCLDSDGDGYGAADDCVYEAEGACSLSGYVVGDGDCDDSNATVYPGKYDNQGRGGDADCDGST